MSTHQRISAAELERRRRLAVERVASGYSQQATADFLGVSKSAVSQWMKAYRQRGDAGLAAKFRPGRPRKLTMRQEKTVLGWFSKSATQFGFANELWTAPRVAKLIRRKWRRCAPRWKSIPRAMRPSATPRGRNASPTSKPKSWCSTGLALTSRVVRKALWQKRSSGQWLCPTTRVNTQDWRTTKQLCRNRLRFSPCFWAMRLGVLPTCPCSLDDSTCPRGRGPATREYGDNCLAQRRRGPG